MKRLSKEHRRKISEALKGKGRCCKTTAEFVREAKSFYVNYHTNVEIVCPHHGSFLQYPQNHLRKRQGCRECFRKEHQGKLSKSWTGFGEISKDHWSSIKRHALNRNIQFDLSIEYAWKLFLKQNHKCALTGWSLKMHTPGRDQKNATWTASLDRIDNNKGYVEGNVEWVHNDVNLMKRHHTTQRFYELCHAVAQYGQQHLTAV